MLKIIKRYSIVSALIMLCFFSAFLALCNGLLTTAKASEAVRTEREYAYTSETTVYIRSTNGMTYEDLAALVSSIKNGNIYLDDMRIFFTEVSGTFRPELLLKQNEALSLPPTVSGTKEINFIPENGIIAPSGVGSIEALTAKDQRLDIIEKNDTEKYGFLVSRFVMNASDFFRIFPDALEGGTYITLIISSNKTDTSEIFSELKQNAAELFPKAAVTGYKKESKASAFRNADSTENMISAGLFLFALINTVIISYYWVTVRRREIAIRKAFGASNFRVIAKMTAELLALIGASAVLAMITQFMIWNFKGDEINLIEYAVLAAGFLFGIMLAVIVSMIVPVRLILQIRPSEGVKL